MSKPRIGEILEANREYTRDAIHVPIIPLISHQFMQGGDPVKLKEGFLMLADSWEESMGIVDPYIEVGIIPGDKVYVWMRPESTMKLWHEWTHPLIDKR